MRTLARMLRIQNLTKRYGNHPVFEGLSYNFEPGCIALNEQESTGKSTLLAVIAGEMVADEGEVFVDGQSLMKTPKQAKARMAYVPGDCLQHPSETGHGLLDKVATQKNTSVDDSILDFAYRLGLEPHLHKRFEQMSTGTRRKVYLAAAALGAPRVVIADGPTDGLDGPACAVLAEQFKLWASNRVVLFASHDAEFVETCGAKALRVGELR